MELINTKNAVYFRLKQLVYGESGVGKTSLAKTLPHNETLIVSAESGTLPLSDCSIDMLDIVNNVLTPLEKFNNLKKSFEFVMKKESIAKYKWIFIDSLTEVASISVDYFATQFPDQKDGLRLWGEHAKFMKTFIKSFRDLPHYNVVFTALSSVEKDENGIRYMGIDIPGKLALQCPAFFDEVFYLDVEKETGKRSLITGKTARLQAKDRSGKLDVREPADLIHIYNKITNQQQKKEK